MKPTFICVGAQKAGTLSFATHFNKHPEVFFHETEQHFFDRDCNFTNEECDISKYEEKFISDKPIRGEKTPEYMTRRIYIDRIHKYDADIKLIILLREPIQRLLSSHNHSNSIDRPWKFSIDNIEESLKLPNSTQFINGKYIDQIEYILTKFPKENIYIGIAEEIKQNPLEEYNKILTFLGAKPFDETFSFNPNIHKRKYLPESKFSEFDKKLLYEFYSPYNERLYTFLGRRIPSWDEFYVKNDLQQ